MIYATEELSGVAFGEAEAELEALASLPVLPAIAAAFKTAWSCMFQHFAGAVIYRREVAGGAPIRIATRAFFREPLEKELVAGVMVSDQTIIIDAQPLIAGLLEWPPQQGDKIVRFPGLSTESLFTSLTVPTVIDVSGEAIVVRLIGRGV